MMPSEHECGAADAAESGCPAFTGPCLPVSGHASRWHPAWAFGLGALVLVAFLYRFADPIGDGDLWWQMRYGGDLLARRSLVPDHGLYTWTPVRAAHIYCAWLGQILLHVLYRAGGLPLLFILRYVCVGAVALVVLVYARQRRLLRHPLTWLVALIAILMSSNAGFIKPQLFSVVLMSVTVLVWFHIRGCPAAAWRWCYVFPLIMVVWVNTHGCFVFGLFFLAVAWAGAEINALFFPDAALPLKVRRHLFAALILTGLAVFATPYGWQYPLQLARSFTGATESMALRKTVRDYDSIFSPLQRSFHFVDFLMLAAALLTALLLAGCRWRDAVWDLILANVGFGFLYTCFLRTTFLWAPVFALSTLSLLAAAPGPWRRPAGRRLAVAYGVAVALFCLWFGLRSIYERYTRPFMCRWLGFGISYFNPVAEAEFILSNAAGYRLGNDYNGGGYLLWRLSPDMKVMIDPRYFPFKDWYARYHLAENGQVEGFLREFPADVWCVVFALRDTVAWFQESPDWAPVFYGPSAVVFARRDLALAAEPLRAAPEIGEIRNLYQGLLVLSFALNVQDFRGAERILAGLETRFLFGNRRAKVQGAVALTRGIRAYYEEEYGRAATHLRTAYEALPSAAGPALASCVLHLAAARWAEQDYAEVRRLLEYAAELAPDDALVLYNRGVTAWALAQGAEGGPDAAAVDWAALLRRFDGRAEAGGGVPPRARQVAAAILAAQFQGLPPLMVPKRPVRNDPGR